MTRQLCASGCTRCCNRSRPMMLMSLAACGVECVNQPCMWVNVCMAAEVASRDLISLMLWVLGCLQSYFSAIKGRWLIRSLAESAVQNCQNFCEPGMHELACTKLDLLFAFQIRFSPCTVAFLRKVTQRFSAGASAVATTCFLRSLSFTCRWKLGGQAVHESLERVQLLCMTAAFFLCQFGSKSK